MNLLRVAGRRLIFNAKNFSPMFFSYPFEYLMTPRVIVVTQEQLDAEKRRIKEKEISRLTHTLDEYSAVAERDINQMKDRLAELKAELEALPAGASN